MLVRSVRMCDQLGRGVIGLLTVGRWEPAGTERMYVGAADSAVGDLDVDVVLCPLLGLKCTPFHLSICGILVVAQPALKLVVGSHDVRCSLCLTCAVDFARTLRSVLLVSI